VTIYLLTLLCLRRLATIPILIFRGSTLEAAADFGLIRDAQLKGDERMLMKLRHASPQRLMFCFSCFLLSIIIACQQRNEVVAGVEVPIPAKMTKNPDKVFDPIPGFQDGQVSYQGKVAPKEIFDFYQEVMAAKGWQPTARFAGNQQDSIGYTKGNRLVLVRYNENPDGTTVLTVMVGTQDPPK
jgi:hypothetical protein